MPTRRLNDMHSGTKESRIHRKQVIANFCSILLSLSLKKNNNQEIATRFFPKKNLFRVNKKDMWIKRLTEEINNIFRKPVFSADKISLKVTSFIKMSRNRFIKISIFQINLKLYIGNKESSSLYYIHNFNIQSKINN